MAVPCQSISRPDQPELDRLELLLEQIKRWRLSGTRCLPRKKSRCQGRRPCYWISMASGPNSPRFSGPKDCSGTSTIGAKLLPMQGWRRRLGKVDPSITSREFRKPQSSIADNTHSTRLAMAAPSAAIRAGFVV